MFIYIQIINLFYSYVLFYANTIKASSRRYMISLVPDYDKNYNMTNVIVQLNGCTIGLTAFITVSMRLLERNTPYNQ